MLPWLLDAEMRPQQKSCDVMASSPSRRRDDCEERKATAMTEAPNDDKPGLVAEKPEHCHDCYRLIRPGERYFLTMELAALCPDCARTTDAIRLAGGLTVEVREDRLLVRRGGAVVKVFPHEVRHLVDALVEAAARLVDRQSGD